MGTDLRHVITGHALQGGIVPGRIEQHPRLDRQHLALSAQASRQRFVVEHRTEAGVYAEQRRHNRHLAIHGQQPGAFQGRALHTGHQLRDARFLHQVAQLQAQALGLE
ncbi:hypothetical protein D3C85_678830 [compost metagenome]